MDNKNNEIKVASQSNGTKGLLFGLVFGSIAGAVSMLFLAPQSGKETRAEVQQGVAQLRDRTTEAVKDRVEQVKSKTDQIKTDLKSKAADLETKGKDLLAKQLGNVSVAARNGKKAIQTS
jgi:gas vesicle protein